MSEVNIDDVDAAVTYSGDWQSSTDLRSYQNTIHFTNSLNSQAKLTFIGNSFVLRLESQLIFIFTRYQRHGLWCRSRFGNPTIIIYP